MLLPYERSLQPGGAALVGLFRSRAPLEAEILIRRHQLNVLRWKSPKRPTFGTLDRLIFAGLYRLFRWCWTPGRLGDREAGDGDQMAPCWLPSVLGLEAASSHGRPRVPVEIRRLIREMSIANPLWGAPRIQWRVPQARHRYWTDQRGQVHG
jgi:hypothetical protein